MMQAVNGIGSAITAPLRWVGSLFSGVYGAVTGTIGGGLNMAVTGAMGGIGALGLGYLFKDPIKQGLKAGGFDKTATAMDDFERDNPHMGTMIMKAVGYGAGAGFAIGAAPAALGSTLAVGSGVSAQTLGMSAGGLVASGVVGLAAARGVEAATGAQILPNKVGGIEIPKLPTM
jgi:hypothetical protein